MWGCFLMSGVKILHFLKDWWKSISIHHNYTMALNSPTLLLELGILIVNIVWLSLIWDTDWLNTVTWLTNISVCCPPQSCCGGGTLIDTTKCFHSGKIFHANKLQNGLAILSLQTCMLTALTAHWLFIARTVQWIRVALRRTVQWIRIVLRAT